MMSYMLTPYSQKVVHRIRYKPGMPTSYRAIRDSAPNPERCPTRLGDADARRIEKAMGFLNDFAPGDRKEPRTRRVASCGRKVSRRIPRRVFMQPDC
jgi:hypothetical protein